MLRPTRRRFLEIMLLGQTLMQGRLLCCASDLIDINIIDHRPTKKQYIYDYTCVYMIQEVIYIHTYMHTHTL